MGTLIKDQVDQVMAKLDHKPELHSVGRDGLAEWEALALIRFKHSSVARQRITNLQQERDNGKHWSYEIDGKHHSIDFSNFVLYQP